MSSSGSPWTTRTTWTTWTPWATHSLRSLQCEYTQNPTLYLLHFYIVFYVEWFGCCAETKITKRAIISNVFLIFGKLRQAPKTPIWSLWWWHYDSVKALSLRSAELSNTKLRRKKKYWEVFASQINLAFFCLFHVACQLNQGSIPVLSPLTW